ncbi:MAG: hypothetical protein RIM72_15105 [Alphaproteobacteria bacterium]
MILSNNYRNGLIGQFRLILISWNYDKNDFNIWYADATLNRYIEDNALYFIENTGKIIATSFPKSAAISGAKVAGGVYCADWQAVFTSIGKKKCTSAI